MLCYGVLPVISTCRLGSTDHKFYYLSNTRSTPFLPLIHRGSSVACANFPSIVSLVRWLYFPHANAFPLSLNQQVLILTLLNTLPWTLVLYLCPPLVHFYKVIRSILLHIPYPRQSPASMSMYYSMNISFVATPYFIFMLLHFPLMRHYDKMKHMHPECKTSSDYR